MTILLTLFAFLMPLCVAPGLLDNAYNSPKTAFSVVMVSLMIGIYMTRLLYGKAPLPKGPLPVLFLALLILNSVSMIYTENPYYTSHAAILYGVAMALFFLTSLHTTPKSALWLLGATSLAGVLISAETWLEFHNIFYLFPWMTKNMQVTGTIGNSNYLGAYLLFPLFALAGLMLPKSKWRILVGLAFGFVFTAFLMTRARGAWLGFAIAFPLFLYLNRGAFSFRGKRFVAGILMLLCVGLWSWNLAPQRLKNQLSIGNVMNNDTLKLRIKKYSASSIWLWWNKNPLFGTGLWSYRSEVFDGQAALQEQDPTFFKDYPEPKPESVHNEYLEVLNDGGVVTAFVLFMILLTWFRHAAQALKENRVVVSACLCAVVGILVDAGFFFPFRINSTLFMTAVFMGVVESQWQRA